MSMPEVVHKTLHDVRLLGGAALASVALATGVGEQPARAQAETPIGGQQAPFDQITDEDVEFCTEQAIGTDNPALYVASGYAAIGRNEIAANGERANLRMFAAYPVANEVSTDCRSIIKERTFTVRQIYRGKVNTKHDLVFSSLDAICEADTKRVGLKHKFTAIKGPKVRGYKQEVVASISYSDGAVYALGGRRTVRGTNDGH